LKKKDNAETQSSLSYAEKRRTAEAEAPSFYGLYGTAKAAPSHRKVMIASREKSLAKEKRYR
jgi:hypothetical protein